MMNDSLLCNIPRDGDDVKSDGMAGDGKMPADGKMLGDSLREAMSAIVLSARHEAAAETAAHSQIAHFSTARPPLKLCVVETIPSTRPALTSPGAAAAGDDSELGRGGLRMAFWLCGFHDALMDRRRNGERLTEREEALLTLSRGDFMGVRPFVIRQALDRLDAVVNAAEWDAAGFGGARDAEARADDPGPMEKFALDTLRDLSRRAQLLLRDEGPDAALSLFDKTIRVQEPLAIFQLVFTTALGLVEAFAKSINAEAGAKAGLLTGLAEALGSEVERI